MNFINNMGKFEASFFHKLSSNSAISYIYVGSTILGYINFYHDYLNTRRVTCHCWKSS
jgi:hypothetical protein